MIIFVSTVLVILCLVHQTVAVDIHVDVVEEKSRKIVKSVKATQADFGPHVNKDIKGYLNYLTPISDDSCSYKEHLPTSSDKWIALMERKNCSFVDMVLAAQNLTYTAVIIFNNEKGGKFNLTSNGSFGTNTNIPSVSASYADGLLLQQYLTEYDDENNAKYYVKITKNRQLITGGDNNDDEEEYKPTPNFFFDLYFYLSIFALIAIVLCCCGIRKYIRHRRMQSDNHRQIQCPPLLLRITNLCKRITTERTILKENQIRKARFVQGHRYETCYICLEDFITGKKNWILPCEHEFHTKCIKPWLTQQQNSCPVCKRMCISLTRLATTEV